MGTSRRARRALNASQRRVIGFDQLARPVVP